MKGAKPRLVIDNDAVTSVPRAPAWLSKWSAAEWRRIMPALVARRILTTADLGSVENYCVAQGRVRQIEEAIPDVAPDSLPLMVRMQDKAMTTARQLAAELGLTPVSRSRPSIRDDGDDDTLLDR